MGARVLVVDDDPWIVRMVTASLEKRNYIVDTAKEGRQALVRAEANRPDVIISDLMMPVMDGWTFVQHLRQHPRLASIPVIFLTALGKDEARLSSLGYGPEDYVSKPFRFDDLTRRVVQALERPPTAADPPRPAPPPAVPYPAPFPYGYPATPSPYPSESSGVGYPAAGYAYGSAVVSPATSHPRDAEGSLPTPPRRSTALNGRLEQLQLSSLLVMMEMERKSGVLTLKGYEGHIGRIFLRGGQVVSARQDQRPELDGRDSVYAMLRWNQGTFSFNAMEVEMEDTVQSSTTHLLMEGARLIDEAKRDLEKR